MSTQPTKVPAFRKDEVNLTPTQERLLGYIAVKSSSHGDFTCSKSELSNRLHCSAKTIDRALQRLRQEGIIVVEEHYLENGGQMANSYRLADGGSVSGKAQRP